MKKRTRIWLIFDLTIVALVFALLAMALNASWAHRYYFSLLREKVGWDIAAADLSINPFLGTIKIKQANILSKNRRQLFSAGQIKLRVSPLAVVRSQFVISSLEVSDVFLDFEKGPPQDKAKESKFTLIYIQKLARDIADSFALRNIVVQKGRIGPVRIVVHRQSEIKTDLQLAAFSFRHNPKFLGESELRFKAKQFAVNGKEIFSRAELNSTLSASQIHFKKLLLERLEGNYELALRARSRREDIKADLDLKVHFPKILKEPVTAQLALQLKPPFLHFESITLSAANASFSGSGRWNLASQEHEFSLAGQELKLAEWAPQFQMEALQSLQGQLDLTVAAQGRFPQLTSQAKLSGRGLVYRAFHAPQAEVEARLAWPGLDLTVRLLEAERHTAAIQAQLDFAAGRPRPRIASFQAELDRLGLATHLPEAKLAGTVSGTTELTEQPAGFSGKAQLSGEAIQSGKFVAEKLELAANLAWPRLEVQKLALQSELLPEFAIVAPLTLTFGPEDIQLRGQPWPGLSLEAAYQKPSGLFKLSSLVYRQADQEIRVSGEYRTNKTFQANLQGEVDAKILEHLRAAFNKAEGGLVLNLRAEGRVDQPVLRGSLRFKRTLLGLRGLAGSIRDLNGALLIDGQRLTLDKLEGYQGDGAFQAGGTVQLSGWKPERFNLAMEGNALSFRLRGMMRAEFDADLKLVGAMPDPLVEGQIDILTGRYYKDFRITEAVFKEDVPVEKEKQRGPDFLQQWRWNLKIRNSGELRIKNNVADVYLLGDLDLKGTTARPRIDGVVTTGAGELHYLGHDLVITEGTLEFRDPVRIRPYLSLEAQEEIAGVESRGLRQYYIIKVRLEGPVDNLQTELDSVPPLDRADVVSLLAFGMTQSELKARGASQGAFATSLVAGSLSSGLGSTLGESVGLDVLRFETAAGSEQAISGVAVGKNLSDRLSVEFYTDISPETAQRRVRSKYYLTDNIFLEGANTIEEQRSKFELNVSFQFKMP